MNICYYLYCVGLLHSALHSVVYSGYCVPLASGQSTTFPISGVKSYKANRNQHYNAKRMHIDIAPYNNGFRMENLKIQQVV